MWWRCVIWVGVLVLLQSCGDSGWTEPENNDAPRNHRTLGKNFTGTVERDRPGLPGIPDTDVSIKVRQGSPVCFAVWPEHLDLGETHWGCAAKPQHFQIVALASQDKRCQETRILQMVPMSRTGRRFRAGGKVAFPLLWKPGQTYQVAVEYEPQGVGHDVGIIQLLTNQEGHPSLEVKVTGKTARLPEQTDIFRLPRQFDTDMLWVIEDSPAMMGHQLSLRNNLEAFMQWLVRVDMDYRLGVITTDVSGQKYPPGCLQGDIKMITPETPNPIQTFLRNGLVGTTGTSRSQPLEAVYHALHNPACNGGFLRDGADLHVMIVSATPDNSPQTVPFYTRFFKQVNGFRNAHKIRISVVTGPPPQGCLWDHLSVPGDFRLWEVARALLGIQDSLCIPNWATSLTGMVGVFFGRRSYVLLSNVADPSTIQVKVNQHQWPESPYDGWSYYEGDNSVNFSKATQPPPGALIEVRHHPLCFPDSKTGAVRSGMMR